jgi:hypothetical protein
VALDAIRSLWLRAPVGDDVWDTVVWSFGLIALLGPPLVGGYWRGLGR